ncbi:MAG TPA: type II toxin-antitoxin system RelE/ParE family toxin [Verrucomicrobiae bacterium]|jgi:plasmid stabilization system protein ParE|nr:type II toxin-antitoxin system RelE/ParE family toxin [Verrucomicrobiae bacterium]
MDFKVIWTDSAIADIKDICEYIALDSKPAAERIGRGILDHVKILETFPFIGPAYPRRSSGAIREIVFRHYRIFYEISDRRKLVHILRVWHGARSEPDLR